MSAEATGDTRTGGEPLGLIVMGPCACGKSEVAIRLSEHYKCAYIEADKLHSAENILKMQQGIPLTDQDRHPWLNKVRDAISEKLAQNSKNTEAVENESNKQTLVRVVVACSALKKAYRTILKGPQTSDILGNAGNNENNIRFLFLNCSRAVLEERLRGREGHFMKLGMLDSQLKTLEALDPTEEAEGSLTLNGDLELNPLVQQIVTQLHLE